MPFKLFSQWVDDVGSEHVEDPGASCAVCGYERHLGREPVLGYVVCSSHRKCSPNVVALVQVLRATGRKLSSAEHAEFRGNSWDHSAIVPHLSDEALARFIRSCENNCLRMRTTVSTTYYERIVELALEAARRLRPEEPVSLGEGEDVRDVVAA